MDDPVNVILKHVEEEEETEIKHSSDVSSESIAI